MEEDNFLEIGNNKSKEAKWNMFKFQDHLLGWISTSAYYFQMRDYPNAFESLTIVYSDTYGFFNKEEQKVVDGLFNKASNDNSNYLSYNINFVEIQKQIRGQIYKPPQDVYNSLLDLRKKLLELMTKYQLTIPQIKKGSAGAGSQ